MKTKSNPQIAIAAAGGLLFLAASSARGATVLWDDVDWPSAGGSPVLQNTVAGIDGGDVTWTFGGDTGTISGLGDSTTLTGGTGASESLGLSWNPNTIGEQITLDITFSHPYGVTGATMSFYDIERDIKKPENAKSGDQITIYATTTTGAIVYPTFSGVGVDVAVIAPGTLIGLDKVKPNPIDNSATITFTDTIASIHVAFSDQGVGRFRAGELHDVGMDGVTFTPALSPIPEPDPRSLLVISPVLYLLVRRRSLGGYR